MWSQIGKAVVDETSDVGEEEAEEDEEDEDEMDELTFEQIIDNEIGLVQKLNHPNIIKVRGSHVIAH